MADPGFLTRGWEVVCQAIICSGGSRISLRRGRQLPRGRQHTILPNFPQNCMKLKEFWPLGRGGTRPSCPP